MYMYYIKQKELLLTLFIKTVDVYCQVVDFQSLTPHHCWFKSHQGLLILSCEEAIQLAFRKSVVLLRCLFVPEMMHRGAPEVFLHH